MNRRFLTLEQLKSVASALLAKINQKPDSNSLSDVSFTGDCNDLNNRPDFSNFVNKSAFQDAEDYIDSNYMMIGRDYVTAGQVSGTTLGNRATAEGINTTASGNYSHAEGYITTASGNSSHAEGYNTSATGGSSHAEGNGTTASGTVSHAEGNYTIANHFAQHVFGEYNVEDTNVSNATARGTYVEIVGNGTANSARSNARTLDWLGNEVLAGKLTVGVGPTNNMDVTTKQYVDTAIGNAASITMIDHSTSTTTELHNLTINKLSQAQYNAISTPDPNQLYMITDDTIYAEKTYVDDLIANINALPAQSGNNGKFLTTNGTTASWASVDLSNYMVKGVDYVTAGQKSGTTLGDNATAEGDSTTASDTGAHAEGGETTASGIYSHAEGVFTTASGHSSHAEGESTIANASRSHAEGYYTIASGRSSHAEGGNTQANGDYTHAEGYGTTAKKKSQHVFGEYNSIDNNGTTTSRGTYVEMVGNGTSASARSNARTLDWSGNESLAGALSLATNKVTMQYNATTHSLDILVS